MNIDEKVMMNVPQEDGTRDRDLNNQVNSENITSSERRSEKYANLMKLNEEESVEWVNMRKNRPSGKREIREMIKWINIKQNRALVTPTAPTLVTEDQEGETVNDTKEAIAKAAIKGGKSKKADLPPTDKEVVDKLKQEAGSVRFTTATFKKDTEKIDAATFKRNSSRLCYWCGEEECLKERMKKWYKENLIQKEPGNMPHLDVNWKNSHTPCALSTQESETGLSSKKRITKLK